MLEDEAHRGKVVEDDRDGERDARSKDRVDAEPDVEQHEHTIVDDKGQHADNAKLKYLRNELLQRELLRNERPLWQPSCRGADR